MVSRSFIVLSVYRGQVYRVFASMFRVFAIPPLGRQRETTMALYGIPYKTACPLAAIFFTNQHGLKESGRVTFQQNNLKSLGEGDLFIT